MVFPFATSITGLFGALLVYSHPARYDHYYLVLSGLTFQDLKDIPWGRPGTSSNLTWPTWLLKIAMYNHV